MPMTPQQSDRLRRLLAGLTPGALICALRLVEAVQNRTREATLVRSWLIDETERRWPEASAAVEAAFDADAGLAEQGIDGPEIDYVGVLLAHVPAEVLAQAPAELPPIMRVLFDGLGVRVVYPPAPAELPTGRRSA